MFFIVHNFAMTVCSSNSQRKRQKEDIHFPSKQKIKEKRRGNIFQPSEHIITCTIRTNSTSMISGWPPSCRTSHKQTPDELHRKKWEIIVFESIVCKVRHQSMTTTIYTEYLLCAAPHSKNVNVPHSSIGGNAMHIQAIDWQNKSCLQGPHNS